ADGDKVNLRDGLGRPHQLPATAAGTDRADDQADFFLVGGADSKINPLSMVRHSLFMPLSRRNDAPEKASRPFDRGRDGIVLGEGSGVLLREDKEHARRRGARGYAEIAGFGSAFDRGRTGAGLARAIRLALAEAGIGPEDIDQNTFTITKTATLLA